MKPTLSLLFAIAALLAHSPATAQNRCEGLFTTEHRGVGQPSTSSTFKTIQLMHQQKSLILNLKGSLDPFVAERFVRYLEAYSKYLAAASDSGAEITRSALNQKEVRLQSELASMQQAALEIGRIRYPKEEVAEKTAERQQFVERLHDIETLWMKHRHVQNRIRIGEQTLKRSRSDGKGSASALRSLKIARGEASEIERSLQSDLARLSLSEHEKGDLRSFFGDRPLDSVVRSILTNSSAIHLSPAAREGLTIAPTKDSAFAVYLQHLNTRHTSRLDREIAVTLEAYSAVAYKYYERLFPWGRNNKFKRNSDVLDLELRSRLNNLEDQLEKKRVGFEGDRRLLEELSARRSGLLIEIRQMEHGLESGSTTIDPVDGVIRLGSKFQELQELESRIASFFPLWSARDRIEMFVYDKFTTESLESALKNEIEAIERSLSNAHRERDGWFARHNTTDGNQADIELF